MEPCCFCIVLFDFGISKKYDIRYNIINKYGVICVKCFGGEYNKYIDKTPNNRDSVVIPFGVKFSFLNVGERYSDNCIKLTTL